ncbi:MAG: hypothetical protein RLZZ579_620 [Actinomycetota bacterium]
MAVILCITADSNALPISSLALLPHTIHRALPRPEVLVDAPRHDLTLLDARANLLEAKSLAKVLLAAGWNTPLLLAVNETGLAALSTEWGLQDFILETASPAETEARIRLAVSNPKTKTEDVSAATGLVIDAESYQAKINGRTLDLTFKEFELLRHLHENPSRVFSREQLLSEVWGYDYFGGTRTVDVHIRRLRAKLGEAESLIDTVRNVGYRLNPEAFRQS